MRGAPVQLGSSMQRRLGCVTRHCSARAARPIRAAHAAAPRSALRCPASANNLATTNGAAAASPGAALPPAKPSAAETARTIVDIVSEGTLSTLSADGMPVGSPVSYTMDKAGSTWVALAKDAPEALNLRANAHCSLMVQPMQFPARSVAAVTLVGSIKLDEAAGPGDTYRLQVDRAMYFGGLDQSCRVQEVGAAEFQAAEPDVLRTSAPELVKHWNEERAEDIYRIVSHQLHVPLAEMAYVELLWVDRLGMYVRTEVEGKEQPSVVRVPFYRAVLDERDARSVITMAAQIAWEAERPYNPSAMLTDAAANN